MPRAEANKSFNKFTAGLITEASPLTFPENASLDETNMVLSTTGPRERRLGVDYEVGGVVADLGLAKNTIESVAITAYEWFHVNDDANLNFLVQQVGADFRFFDLALGTISTQTRNGGNAITLTMDASKEAQYTSIIGHLVVATGEQQFTIFEYNATTDTIVATTQDLLIRDFFGVEDTVGVLDRPTSLSEAHNYNLHNQGWTTTNINAFKSSQGVYPSNADVMSLAKDLDDNFDAGLLVKQFFGSTPAPKGSSVINAFTRGATRTIGGTSATWKQPLTTQAPFSFQFPNFFNSIDYTAPSATLPEDKTSGGCRAVETYAGRVFYSGAGSDLTDGDARSPNLGSYIFFSQVLDNISKAGACHSEADPASEHISDIIASDGGTIKIPAAANISKLLQIGNSLLVFSDRGIWEINGGDKGFSAVEFRVRKISSIGITSSNAVVDVGSAVFYWSVTDIFVISPDKVTGQLNTQSVTLRTIKTLYSNIPEIVKDSVVGTYDVASKQVRWLYSTAPGYDGVTDRYHFDKELVFDLTLNAFFKHEVMALALDSPYVTGYVNTPGVLTDNVTFNIIVSGNQVVAGFNDVKVTKKVRSRGDRTTRYITLVPGTSYGVTFSLYRRDDFLDWYTKDSVGKDAAAFLLTGFEVFQDTQRNKKVTYLTCQFGRTETAFDAAGVLANQSSCMVQAQWEWTNSAAAGRWSPAFQAYRLNRNFLHNGNSDLFDYGFTVVSTRNKIRGKGRALSLLFSSEAGKDLKILGWSENVTGEKKV